LACGLPVIINSKIGDTDSIVNQYKIWTVINSFTIQEYQNAIKSIIKLKNNQLTSLLCKNVAEKKFDLIKGVDSYNKIYLKMISRQIK